MSKLFLQWTWMVVAVVSVLFLPTGCRTESGESRLAPIKQMFTGKAPPTPEQAAHDAFNMHDADKRRRAVILLSDAPFGGEPTYLKMYRLLIDDPDPTVRSAAIAALGRHGQSQDVPLLAVHLQDDVDIVRWEAAIALQKIHNPEAVAPLIRALDEDADTDVRIAAAAALAQYQQPQVFDALVGALNDDDYAVANTAQQSLVILTGQKLGPNGRDWLDWARNQTNLFENARADSEQNAQTN